MFKGRCFPKVVILQVVYFNFRFSLSYRDIEELLEKVSRENKKRNRAKIKQDFVQVTLHRDLSNFYTDYQLLNSIVQ
jgi:hypothetical protein